MTGFPGAADWFSPISGVGGTAVPGSTALFSPPFETYVKSFTVEPLLLHPELIGVLHLVSVSPTDPMSYTALGPTCDLTGVGCTYTGSPTDVVPPSTRLAWRCQCPLAVSTTELLQVMELAPTGS